MWRLFVLLWILTLASPAFAATYYVSTTGDNGNAGTSAGAAWETLQHAHDTATNGDTIMILAGQYYQRVRITKNSMTWTGEVGTIVDGSDSLTGWSAYGDGIYRVSTPGYEPFELMALSTTAKLSVQKYANSMMNGTVCENCCGTGLDVMAFATDALCENRIYWDGWEAGFGVTGGFVYLRFRNGEDPDDMSVRVSPGATTNRGTFTIDGGDNNIIENMDIGGGLNAVALVNNADNNTIRNNILRNGRNQVYVGTATGTIIENNSMDTRLIGSTAGYAATPYQAGDWSTTQHPETKPKLNIYHHNKFEVGLSGEQSGGIYCNPCGSSMIVDGNTIIGGTVGVHLDGFGTGAIIRNNLIGYQSAESVYYSEHYDAEIYNNVFFDNNSGIRIQDMEGYNGTKTGYIYRNHFHMALKFAEGIQFGFIVKEISPHTLYVYHNTFTMEGSQDGYALNLSGGDGPPPTAMPGMRAVNNVFSGIQMYPTSFLNCDTNGNDSLGMYSYNHSAMGENINGGSSGNCGNNTEGGPNPIWSDPLNETLLPPAGHAALDSAIRLDQPWTINSTEYPALPGMAGGYYPDSTPHRGAIQEEEVAGPPEANITDGHVKPGKKYGKYGRFRMLDKECNAECKYRELQRHLYERNPWDGDAYIRTRDQK